MKDIEDYIIKARSSELSVEDQTKELIKRFSAQKKLTTNDLLNIELICDSPKRSLRKRILTLLDDLGVGSSIESRKEFLKKIRRREKVLSTRPNFITRKGVVSYDDIIVEPLEYRPQILTFCNYGKNSILSHIDIATIFSLVCPDDPQIDWGGVESV